MAHKPFLWLGPGILELTNADRTKTIIAPGKIVKDHPSLTAERVEYFIFMQNARPFEIQDGIIQGDVPQSELSKEDVAKLEATANETVREVDAILYSQQTQQAGERNSTDPAVLKEISGGLGL